MKSIKSGKSGKSVKSAKSAGSRNSMSSTEVEIALQEQKVAEHALFLEQARLRAIGRAVFGELEQRSFRRAVAAIVGGDSINMTEANVRISVITYVSSSGGRSRRLACGSTGCSRSPRRPGGHM